MKKKSNQFSQLDLFNMLYEPGQLIEVKINYKWVSAEYIGTGTDIRHSMVKIDGQIWNHLNTHIRKKKST